MTAIQDFLFDHYQWLLVGHIVSMVAWMAGIFYLPRLFVYHAEQAGVGSETSELFKVMELKLFRLIMNPSMISTWVFGLLMIWANGLDWVLATPWLQLKLVMVSAMTWFH
ncbi:MAG: CopD family protein, partial [Pseudomonadota bacterium]